jgi:gamma-glutamylcyclotransferase (GGCT)/AIG2-like uncharacterized protein YtfP
MKSNLYAFYGSLRRGLHNYQQFKPNLKYRFTAWLSGFQLFSLGDFPFAIKSGNDADKVLIEVFEIEDEITRRKIDELEVGFGYHSEVVLIEDVEIKIYLFTDKANYPQVQGGDWVKFFRG